MRNIDQLSLARLLLVLGSLMAVACEHVALADPEEPAVIPDTANTQPDSETVSLTGPEVYNAICIACHSPPGVGGAPPLGDGDAWSARIAQGMDTLIDHALNGYSGDTGIMPRKGGRTDLSDEDVIAAVRYMVEQLAD